MTEGRDQLVDYLRQHLIGPLRGATEEVNDPPSYLYTAGVLFPIGASTELLTAEEEATVAQVLLAMNWLMTRSAWRMSAYHLLLRSASFSPGEQRPWSAVS